MPVAYQALHWFQAVQPSTARGPNRKGKHKSAYMRIGFPRKQVETIYKYLTKDTHRVDMTQSLLRVDSYGGEVNTVDPRATAVWQRSSILKLQYQSYWQDTESGPSPNSDAHIAWMYDFYGEMYADYGSILSLRATPPSTSMGATSITRRRSERPWRA